MSNDKLELLSLKASPYSRRVVWALKLLQIEYTPLTHELMAGEISMRWRLGRWKPWERVTVPVGFVVSPDASKPELHLEHGLDIVEWADDKAMPQGIAPLVPTDKRGEIVRFCGIADELLEFDRQMFLKASWKDPSLLRVFVGPGPPDAALPVISFISGTFMSCKYRSTLKATVSETREKLDAMEQELVTKQKEQPKKELVYLVDDSLTLADIYMSLSVCGGPKVKLNSERSRIYKAIASISFDMKAEYPVLYQWALDIAEKHSVPV